MYTDTEPPRYAKEGDLVLLQERRDVFVPVVLKAGDRFENRHGLFTHDDMIGAEFGAKVCLCVRAFAGV